MSDFNKKGVYISVIIPVYNEAERIPNKIDEICKFIFSLEKTAEIIFVNDGSIDMTEKILESYKHIYPFRFLSYINNRGKGYAIRKGVKNAIGDWILFFDIDLATPLSEVNHLLKFLKNDDGVVIGSRRFAQSNIQKSESLIRTFLGQGFTRLSNIFVPEITDFTCGFKCFSKFASKKIFSVARINRWGFDTELLYIAKLNNIPLREIPVTWAHDEDSRVHVVGAIVSSLIELFQMKLNHLRGFYK